LRNDHKVSFRREESVKAAAEKARTVLVRGYEPAFSVVECIRKLTREEILPAGKLILNFERRPTQSPAYVKLPEGILVADPEFWEESQDNLPELRFILGHELGHLFLHDHYAQRFSGLQSKAWLPEESAEWQADRFSDYFLVSDEEVAWCVTPNCIANYCAVTREVAIRRLGRKFRYSGEACPKCGNFTMVRNCASLKCDICGVTAGRS
jgi:hypothetical protein